MANDTTHYRLQYNLPGTWSQKYNIIFQYILGLGLFPEDVMMAESIYYQKQMNTYGIPLDNRAQFTKTDWSSWVAAMGSDDQFSAIIEAIYKFADTSPSRVPFTDWYFTDTGLQKGFRARPVIGGLYVKHLLETQP